MKCKLSLLLTSFVLAFAFLFVPINASAASEWNGPVEFAEETIRILMEQSTVVTAPMTNATGTGIKQATVTYSGEASNILRVGGLSGSSVIDGTLVLYGSIPLTASTTNRSVGLPTLVFEANTPDGITFGGYIRSNSSSAVNYAIEVQFNEYYSTSSTLNIPFKISMKQMMIYQNLDTNYISTITTSYLNNFQFGGEWAGLIDVYTDLQDNPSMDGYFAEQNQQIIDNSQTQINNQQTIIQDIQNQTNQQHQDSQAQINQSIANTETMVNGFDTTDSDLTSSSLENDFSSLENAEADSIDFAQTALRGFSIPAGGIQGLAEGMTASMSLVTSMAQAIFEASEAFGTIIVAVFALVIVGMVIGLAKFMR